MKKRSGFKYTMVTTRSLFTITLIIIALTILGVWRYGLKDHLSIFHNALVSTTILSISFFLFLTVGLYKGIKLKDDIRRLTISDHLYELPDIPKIDTGDHDFDFDGIAGILLSVFLWIVVSVIVVIILWIFSAVLWSVVVVLVGSLYWIFFRALSVVFEHSETCKGQLSRSLIIGLSYTFLYNIWIYVIIMMCFMRY